MVEIRRQADTHSPAGVNGVRGEVSPGAMTGAAPTRNQVRQALLRVESLPDGKLRISSPQARGWAVVVRTRDELVRAIAVAFTEVQVASYAAWRGEPYELDALTLPDEADPLAASAELVNVSAAKGRSDRRTDVHPVTAWTPLGGGKWRSPGGREYREDSQAVRLVLAKRHRMGLGVGDCDPHD